MVRSKILENIKGIDHYFFNGLESTSKTVVNLLKESYSCQQVHNNRISKVQSKKFYSDCDGLIADKKSTIVIRSADCLPIFLFERDRKIITALHAGWRGLLCGIINNYCKMTKVHGDMRKVYAGIGPHIGICCYKVKKPVIDSFSKLTDNIKQLYQVRQNSFFLDLGAVAKYQMMKVGIPLENIEDTDICTNCSESYFSYRRDKSEKRNYSFLSLQ